ncbi:hypothetical protein NHX12_023724 [Muraenolepis orangiensis]|uniref:LIM/homeobox protein Lhx9 n=1 Tax=Muraenolepis orangiensis TaxID=630683 RepID=A0A9Q0EPC5_9TELE|nr:hypothetical protein NHX12_023724 [Muraenolepis orangiensis]
MMSSDDSLEDILYGGHRDNGPEAGSCRDDRGDGTQNDGHTHSSQEPITCAGCGSQISDRFFLLAAGRAWHGACLRCCQCQRELQTSPSLFWRGGNIYCQQDYCRLFVIGRCARCHQPIPSTALVMRSGDLTFHPHCFSCQECDITLLPGNLYFLQGRSLYWEESASSPESRLDDKGEEATGGCIRRQNKRIRTCFRSEQLRALESYFAQKHNPDGKDWTCLAHKTGLPKRVLQVWFQNARAKMRRSVSMDDSPTSSRTDTVATSSLPHSPLYPTSTIDQSQLSLLTDPLDASPPTDRSGGPDRSFLLDFSSQGATGVGFREADKPMGSEGGCDVTGRHF